MGQVKRFPVFYEVIKMVKIGTKGLVSALVLILIVQLVSIHQAKTGAELYVNISQENVTVSAGTPASVYVTYQNMGNTDYDINLYIYDEGSNKSSPRPVLEYERNRYTTEIREKVVFGSMDLPLGQSKTINVTFEVYPNVTSGNYKMRIGGIVKNGNSYEDRFTLIVSCQGETLSIPYLNSPQNHAQNVSLNPTFSWTSVNTAQYYVIHISTDQSFGSIDDSKKVYDTGYTRDSDLEEKTTYYWRVRAENDCGVSGWSEPWDFTTGTTPPISFEMLGAILAVGIAAALGIGIYQRKRKKPGKRLDEGPPRKEPSITEAHEVLPRKEKPMTAETYETLKKMWDNVKKTKNLKEKGKLLEDFIEKLLEVSKRFTIVGRDIRSDFEEIDIMCTHKLQGIFKKVDPVLLIECKNWSKKAGKDELVTFFDKVTNRKPHSNLGIFLSVNGFTKGVRDFLKSKAESDVKIMLVSGKDIDEMFAKNKDFLSLLEEKFTKNILLMKE